MDLAAWFRRTEQPRTVPTVAELTARAIAARADVKALSADADRLVIGGTPSP